MRILIVEDEPSLNEALKKLLQNANYAVDCCFDGLTAREHLSYTEYDGVVLDIMLPGLDGISLLRGIRAAGNPVPVLLLTARDGVEDRVRGLDAGADDYLVKPFAGEELLARIRAMLRRRTESAPTDRLTLADLTVDTTERRVFRGEKELFLSAREYAILEYLIRNRGIVLSRQRIEDHIWNYDYEGGSNVVDVYIRKLRKLVDEGFEKKLIHTVRGMGYVLREEA